MTTDITNGSNVASAVTPSQSQYLFTILIRFQAVDDIEARKGVVEEIIPRVDSMKYDFRLADIATKFQEVRKDGPPRKIEI